MSDTWLGSIVSVNCGDVLGIFKGEISIVDKTNQTISLINVSRNNVKCQVPEITLSTNDIKGLKIIESTKDKSSEKSNDPPRVSAFSKPATSINGYSSCSPNPEAIPKKKADEKRSVDFKPLKKTDPKKSHREKNNDCFSAPIDSDVLDMEFDFEKNLALFDKRAVFDEINALSKGDRLRLVDFNKSEAKYRHNENVLDTDVPILKQISVPCESSTEYVTDSGLLVPSVTVDFKKSLYTKAEEVGIISRVRVENVGKSACEMVLHLVGGSHRLNPQNNHQRPSVIILAGSSTQGAQAINCGRQLSNHLVNSTVVCPPHASKSHSILAYELKLFSLSGGKIVYSAADLSSSVDIIVDSLESYEKSHPDDKSWSVGIRQWVKQCKSPILCLDPPPHCDTSNSNFILCPALPFAFQDSKCSIHICDIGFPKGVYSSVGCTYSSPFGSKFSVPLYSAVRNAQ